MIKVGRLPFILAALISLIIGLWAGLIRIGWSIPVNTATPHHGAIMVGGFLGTLIALEKIIPLRKKWLFFIPGASAASVIFFFLNLPLISIILLIFSGAGLTCVLFTYFLRNRSIEYLLMSSGGLCWMIGNILLFHTNFYPIAVPWWIGFTLLIITAERLELMKFLPVEKKSYRWLYTLLSIFFISLVLSFHGTGKIITGCALAGIAIWLMKFDVIGITIRKNELPKFVAIALLCGYFALLLTGIFSFSLASQAMGFDAVVHTFFIGFVFSMIFAHGPIILPGILGISVKPFSRQLYGWLFLLHSSWLIRLAADVHIDFEWRRISGIVATVAIFGYFITIAIVTARRIAGTKVS